MEHAANVACSARSLILYGVPHVCTCGYKYTACSAGLRNGGKMRLCRSITVKLSFTGKIPTIFEAMPLCGGVAAINKYMPTEKHSFSANRAAKPRSNHSTERLSGRRFHRLCLAECAERDSGRSEVEDQDAVLIYLGVVEMDGFGQVYAKFLHQPIGPYEASAVAALFCYGEGIAGRQRRRFQADAVVYGVKKQVASLGLAELLERPAAHRDIPSPVHRYI